MKKFVKLAAVFIDQTDFGVADFFIDHQILRSDDETPP